MLEVEYPRVLEHLDQRDSLIRILLEELVDQVFILLRYLALEGDLLANLVTCDRLLVSAIRCITMDQLV